MFTELGTRLTKPRDSEAISTPTIPDRQVDIDLEVTGTKR